MNRDAGYGLVVLYIGVLEIPVCVLLLVQLPQRNQLCLMEFLIVCPEFESRSSWNYWRSYVLQETGGVAFVSQLNRILSRSENTGGCIFNDFGDAVMLWMNGSSNAVNCWDMTRGHGRPLRLSAKGWLCMSMCVCVCVIDTTVSKCSMFYSGHMAK